MVIAARGSPPGGDGMQKIADTPEPPYYAVIAPAVVDPTADLGEYAEMAARLVELARQCDGFLGLETCFQGNFALAVSYWRSLEAIDAWRRHARHLHAKELAKTRWFESYVTRIARVERAY
jgi:heme-degrading monooxygenase HmoA